MASQTSATDKGTGLTILFGTLALAGAGISYLGHGTELSGWGFAAAMLFGALLVVAVHAYE